MSGSTGEPRDPEARRGARTQRARRTFGASRTAPDGWASRARRGVRRRAPLEDLGPIADDEWSVAREDDPQLRRVQGPTPLGAELARLAGRTGWAERLGAATLTARWEDVVGPDLVARCTPLRIAGGVLVVAAESAAWATQLRYLHAQLIEQACEVLGPGSVREVRIVVGRVDGSGAAGGTASGHDGGASGARDGAGTGGRRSGGRGRGRRQATPPPLPPLPPDPHEGPPGGPPEEAPR
jgi:hypothetical protein